MAGQPESVAELFEAALALKPSERDAFLDQACGRDSALRHTVENLLAQNACASSFLQHPAFSFLGHKAGDFPVSERIGRTGLHFGVHQYLTDDDIDYIGETVTSYFAKAG